MWWLFNEGSSLVPEQTLWQLLLWIQSCCLHCLGVFYLFFAFFEVAAPPAARLWSACTLLPPPFASHSFLRFLCFFLPVVTKDGVYVLDMAAKIDATADYICKAKWGNVEFPPPFGREAYPEVRGHIFASNSYLK